MRCRGMNASVVPASVGARVHHMCTQYASSHTQGGYEGFQFINWIWAGGTQGIHDPAVALLYAAVGDAEACWARGSGAGARCSDGTKYHV